MDNGGLEFIVLFVIFPSCLWLLSRLSFSKSFKTYNTILFAAFFINIIIALMPPFVFNCDGSVLHDYRNCLHLDDKFATTIGRASFFGGLVIISAYAFFIVLSLMIYAYKKFQNNS